MVGVGSSADYAMREENLPRVKPRAGASAHGVKGKCKDVHGADFPKMEI